MWSVLLIITLDKYYRLNVSEGWLHALISPPIETLISVSTSEVRVLVYTKRKQNMDCASASCLCLPLISADLDTGMVQACPCRLIVRPRIEEAAKGKMITDFILFLPLLCRPLDNTQTVWQTVRATVEGKREGQRDIKLATKSLPLTASRSQWPFFSLCLQLVTFIFTAILLYRKTYLLDKNEKRKEDRNSEQNACLWGIWAYRTSLSPSWLNLVLSSAKSQARPLIMVSGESGSSAQVRLFANKQVPQAQLDNEH